MRTAFFTATGSPLTEPFCDSPNSIVEDFFVSIPPPAIESAVVKSRPPPIESAVMKSRPPPIETSVMKSMSAKPVAGIIDSKRASVDMQCGSELVEKISIAPNLHFLNRKKARLTRPYLDTSFGQVNTAKSHLQIQGANEMSPEFQTLSVSGNRFDDLGMYESFPAVGPDLLGVAGNANDFRYSVAHTAEPNDMKWHRKVSAEQRRVGPLDLTALLAHNVPDHKAQEMSVPVQSWEEPSCEILSPTYREAARAFHRDPISPGNRSAIGSYTKFMLPQPRPDADQYQLSPCEDVEAGHGNQTLENSTIASSQKPEVIFNAVPSTCAPLPADVSSSNSRRKPAANNLLPGRADRVMGSASTAPSESRQQLDPNRDLFPASSTNPCDLSPVGLCPVCTFCGGEIRSADSSDDPTAPPQADVVLASREIGRMPPRWHGWANSSGRGAAGCSGEEILGGSAPPLLYDSTAMPLGLHPGSQSRRKVRLDAPVTDERPGDYVGREDGTNDSTDDGIKPRTRDHTKRIRSWKTVCQEFMGLPADTPGFNPNIVRLWPLRFRSDPLEKRFGVLCQSTMGPRIRCVALFLLVLSCGGLAAFQAVIARTHLSNEILYSSWFKFKLGLSWTILRLIVIVLFILTPHLPKVKNHLESFSCLFYILFFCITVAWSMSAYALATSRDNSYLSVAEAAFFARDLSILKRWIDSLIFGDVIAFIVILDAASSIRSRYTWPFHILMIVCGAILLINPVPFTHPRYLEPSHIQLLPGYDVPEAEAATPFEGRDCEYCFGYQYVSPLAVVTLLLIPPIGYWSKWHREFLERIEHYRALRNQAKLRGLKALCRCSNASISAAEKILTIVNRARSLLADPNQSAIDETVNNLDTAVDILTRVPTSSLFAPHGAYTSEQLELLSIYSSPLDVMHSFSRGTTGPNGVLQNRRAKGPQPDISVTNARIVRLLEIPDESIIAVFNRKPSAVDQYSNFTEAFPTQKYSRRGQSFGSGPKMLTIQQSGSDFRKNSRELSEEATTSECHKQLGHVHCVLERYSLMTCSTIAPEAILKLQRGLGVDWDVDFLSAAAQMPPCNPYLDHGNRQQGDIFVEVGFQLLSCHLDLLTVHSETLVRFLYMIQTKYRANPYHNALHGAMVAHWSVVLSNALGVFGDDGAVGTGLDFIGMVIAALCHDVGHPGRNNAFLINTCDVLATVYNDNGILENFHCCLTFDTLSRGVRKQIIDIILATDMSQHFEHISRMRVRKASGQFDYTRNADDLAMVLRMCVKMADLGHVLLDWPLHYLWAMRVAEEFYQQGEEETRLGLMKSPLCDRVADHENLCKSQKGFLQFVVDPLLKELELLHPKNFLQMVAKLQDNTSRWEALIGQKIDPIPEDIRQLATSTDLLRPYLLAIAAETTPVEEAALMPSQTELLREDASTLALGKPQDLSDPDEQESSKAKTKANMFSKFPFENSRRGKRRGSGAAIVTLNQFRGDSAEESASKKSPAAPQKTTSKTTVDHEAVTVARRASKTLRLREYALKNSQKMRRKASIPDSALKRTEVVKGTAQPTTRKTLLPSDVIDPERKTDCSSNGVKSNGGSEVKFLGTEANEVKLTSTQFKQRTKSGFRQPGQNYIKKSVSIGPRCQGSNVGGGRKPIALFRDNVHAQTAWDSSQESSPMHEPSSVGDAGKSLILRDVEDDEDSSTESF